MNNELESFVCYIGLGSNLNDPVYQVQRALGRLGEIPQTVINAYSDLFQSTPTGPQDQPDFINAVACISTSLEPVTLLAALKQIEQDFGRQPVEHWGPRVIDLDILLYGDQMIDTNTLKVPHPCIADRAFVVHPLSQIAPDLIVPGIGAVPVLLQQHTVEAVTKVA